MSNPKFSLEVLSGPLDGRIITLEGETRWDAQGDGPLSFPWDTELGDPQARFFCKEGEWWLEGFKASHGMYRLSGEGERVSQAVRVTEGDLLKAGQTWLLVRQTESN